MFVGLVRDPSGPDRPDRPEGGGGLPHVPWRPFAWLAAFLWAMYLAGEIGGLAGYLLVIGAIGVCCWRLDRWCSKQSWGGLDQTQR
jgi:hypothetical protein